MLLHGRVCIPITMWNKNNMSKMVCQRFFATKVSNWKPTVGLEIHAQIATDSKLFSGASTNFASSVNSSVSLFDCAIPGTMPVLNRKCVEAGVLTALALSCEVNEVSMFERKHYFYADLPAGYQITQQKKPLATNGGITFEVFTPGIHKVPYSKSSKIKQIQLEQDSGKSLHDEIDGRSLIDLNRAGVPLMELVFEPDLADGEEAAALVKELIIILQLLQTCSCKMEEGALRVDANVSVSTPGEPLGVRTELKNIGSVRAVAAAIKFEINRQISILEEGGQIVNETRAWDAIKKKTILLREKEDKHDYRFMPETNLPPLYLHVNENTENISNLVDVPSLKKELPQLPEKEREELRNMGLSAAMIIVIMGDLSLRRLFYDLLKDKQERNPQTTALFLANNILTFINGKKLDLEFFFSTEKRSFIGEVIDLVQTKVIGSKTALKLLDSISQTDKTPKQIVEEKNWYLISDEKILESICSDIVKKNPKIVKKYKKGKTEVMAKLCHQVLVATEDTANIPVTNNILKRLLNSP